MVPAPLTSAVPEVCLVGRVVLAQPLQDLLVVHEPVQRAQEEGVERQVAHLLQLEVSAQVLQPPGAPDAGLQRLQGLAVLPQVRSQWLSGRKTSGEEPAQWNCMCTRPAHWPSERRIPSAVPHFIKSHRFQSSWFISLY